MSINVPEVRISGTLKERWEVYRRYVVSTLSIIEKTDPFSPATFACESALISGEDPARIPWPELIASMRREWETSERAAIQKEIDAAQTSAQSEEAKRRLENLKYPLPQWADDFQLNDITVASACIASTDRPRRDIMDPKIVNMSLCRNKMEPKWRRTTFLGSSTGFPAARHVERLVRLWRLVVLFGADRLVDLPGANGPVDAPLQDRQVFSWAMQDAFISFQPFKDGNERTARAMLQLIRNELKLPPVFISRKDITFHRERIRLFRAEFFVPLMDHCGLMG